MISRVARPINYAISNYPKYQAPKRNKPTLRRSEFNQKVNGFLVYDSKQTRSYRVVSAFFVLCIIGSFLKHHYANQFQKLNDKIIIGIIITSLVVYQWRLMTTLKRVVIDRRGENILLIRYGPMGFYERHLQTPIQIMQGVTKATRFGGNMIYGGGVYGFGGKSFWFHSSGITHKEAFDAAVSGRFITIID